MPTVRGLCEFLKITKIVQKTLRIQSPIHIRLTRSSFPLQTTIKIIPHLPVWEFPQFFSSLSIFPEEVPTLGDAQLHFQVDRRGDDRLGEDQHVLQANHHDQVGKDLSGGNRKKKWEWDLWLKKVNSKHYPPLSAKPFLVQCHSVLRWEVWFHLRRIGINIFTKLHDFLKNSHCRQPLNQSSCSLGSGIRIMEYPSCKGATQGSSNPNPGSPEKNPKGQRPSKSLYNKVSKKRWQSKRWIWAPLQQPWEQSAREH